MRSLTFEEAKFLFLKIVKYKKGNLYLFIKEKTKNLEVFRIQKFRVYETLIGITRYTNHFQEHQIASSGTCIARYTHTKRLWLTVPFLKLTTEFPPSNSLGCTRHGESQFLRGFHLPQANLGWTKGKLLRGEGVFIVGTTGINLGFGEIISSIQFFNNLNYRKTIIANQGDIGSYTRIYEPKISNSKNNV
jgi:hypothetical protein